MTSSYEPYASTDLPSRAKQAMTNLENAAKSLAQPDRRRTYAECANVIEELEAKVLAAEELLIEHAKRMLETGPRPIIDEDGQAVGIR